MRRRLELPATSVPITVVSRPPRPTREPATSTRHENVPPDILPPGHRRGRRSADRGVAGPPCPVAAAVWLSCSSPFQRGHVGPHRDKCPLGLFDGLEPLSSHPKESFGLAAPFGCWIANRR